jgi:hypothetical protein
MLGSSSVAAQMAAAQEGLSPIQLVRRRSSRMDPILRWTIPICLWLPAEVPCVETQRLRRALWTSSDSFSLLGSRMQQGAFNAKACHWISQLDSCFGREPRSLDSSSGRLEHKLLQYGTLNSCWEKKKLVHRSHNVYWALCSFHKVIKRKFLITLWWAYRTKTWNWAQFETSADSPNRKPNFLLLLFICSTIVSGTR